MDNVNAHDEGEEWLMINESSDLVENNIPITSTLLWAPHILEKDFSTNQEVSIEADKDILSKNLSLSEDNLEITFKIETEFPFDLKVNEEIIHSNQIKDKYFIYINSSKVILYFLNSGSYFITSDVGRKESNILDSEEFMINIDGSIQPSSLKVNNILIQQSNRNQKFNRKDVVTFEVNNPDFNKYSYKIDFGNSEVADISSENENSVKRRFLNEKTPLFVVLRTEDKNSHLIADSYVKLDSDDPSAFQVVKPATEIDDSKIHIDSENPIFSSRNIIMLIVVFEISILSLSTYQKLKRP